MTVVSAPCSCQTDCLVCGRGDVPPHDCAIHVLLESMVFQEHMLYGEPTEARLEEILQNGKEYLPRAMHMTDQNSVLLNHGLQPPEIIDLHTEQRIGELLTIILWTFFASEPLLVQNQRTCPVTTWSRRLPKEPSFKLSVCQIQLAYKAWKRQGPQNLTTWTLLAQAVDVMQRNGPIPCPRRMLHLSDALARKDTLWPWVYLQCLLQHLDVNNTLCWAPLRTS
ncbi:uncharacterized protein TNCV_2502011 [Trichonephila clavipes]|nr:uncharacterized protein TNCV_2502011 [Trichonephila clavipes]